MAATFIVIIKVSNFEVGIVGIFTSVVTVVLISPKSIKI